VGAIGIVIVLAIALDTNHSYWHNPVDNASRILLRAASVGIIALGASVVIISGGIDLSVGSTMAFSGTMCALTMYLLCFWLKSTFDIRIDVQNTEPVGFWIIAAGIFVAILSGFLIGSLHTWLVTSVGLPPFVATLATLVGLRSLARAMVGGVTEIVSGAAVKTQINVQSPDFRFLGNDLWVVWAVFLVLAAVIAVLLNWTVLGRHIYAVGGNEQAARLSGIQTDGVKWLAYVIGGVTASIAGVLTVAETSVANPQNLGQGQELNAIAASVIGGCSLQGGIGTVLGTVLGSIFLRVVIDAVSTIIKAQAEIYEGFIVGVSVALTVAFSQFRQAAALGRKAFPGWLGFVSIAALALLAGVVVSMTSLKSSGVTTAIALGSGVAIAVAIGLGIWKFNQERQT